MCVSFSPILSTLAYFYPSTAHPTLNRHSPPEVVANFKRRVPPRLPKPRKRDVQEQVSMPPSRSAIGMGPVPLIVPSSVTHPSHKLVSGAMGRARGFSAPGSFTLTQGGGGGNANGWGNNYRSALPPLMVPSDPPPLSQQNSMYSHSPHTLHPITPSDDPPSSNFHPMSNYSSSARDMVVPSSQPYSAYPGEQNNWSYHSNSSSHNSSLSSLLNPSNNGYSRPTPTINTSYGSPFSSMPMQGEHSASSLSPDSRPTTGYSMSSVSSMPPYHDDYSRPNSSHHRPISPSRPTSSKGSAYPTNAGSLRVGRARRHSQAISPYPSPYDHSEQQRPSTSPQPPLDSDHHNPHNVHQSAGGGLPRVRSMIQLPSVDPYSFANSQADFAYSAIPGQGSMDSSLSNGDGVNGWGVHSASSPQHGRNVRPSTSTSSISAASHTSSSQANTPPVPENYNGETDINRCKSHFQLVPFVLHALLDSHHARPISVIHFFFGVCMHAENRDSVSHLVLCCDDRLFPLSTVTAPIRSPGCPIDCRSILFWHIPGGISPRFDKKYLPCLDICIFVFGPISCLRSVFFHIYHFYFRV